MSASRSCHPNIDTESQVIHNPAPTGLEDLRGLLFRLKNQTMTEMKPGKDSYEQRKQLYEQFVLVAMLIKTETPETRIQFIDIARLLNPDTYKSIDENHILKILVKWKILKSEAKKLQKIPAFMNTVYGLLYHMKRYTLAQKNIYQYIPRHDPIDFDDIDELEAAPAYLLQARMTGVSMILDKRLLIRNVCLELAMIMQDPPKIRVLFLDLAYYFEPTFRTNIIKHSSENQLNLEIQTQWQMMQNPIAFRNRNDHNTNELVNMLRREMKSYTVEPAQSQSYMAHQHKSQIPTVIPVNSQSYTAHQHKSRQIPTVIPVNSQSYTANQHKSRLPVILYPRTTKNEIDSQATTSELTSPVAPVKPCRCAGCRCRGCEYCNSSGQDGRCRCVHDAGV